VSLFACNCCYMFGNNSRVHGHINAHQQFITLH